MLGEYDFHLSQVQYLKSAMDQLPTFAPLAMTAAQMKSEYDAGLAVRTVFLSKSSAAMSPAAGHAQPEYDALHTTSFDVLHKGPDETEFTTVADDTINLTFDASGLAPAITNTMSSARTRAATAPRARSRLSSSRGDQLNVAVHAVSRVCLQSYKNGADHAVN